MKSVEVLNDEMVTIATYASPQEASIPHGALIEEGIAAYLANEETANTLSYVGSAVGGVQLQVRREDAQRAADFLAQIHGDEPSATTPAWVCPNCEAEVDAGFEVCWSCGKLTDLDSNQAETLPFEKSEPPIALQPATDDSQESEKAGDETARRAWFSAVLGAVFPPLLIYSLIMIFLTSGKELSLKGTRRFYGAMILTALLIIGYWILSQFDSIVVVAPQNYEIY